MRLFAALAFVTVVAVGCGDDDGAAVDAAGRDAGVAADGGRPADGGGSDAGRSDGGAVGADAGLVDGGGVMPGDAGPPPGPGYFVDQSCAVAGDGRTDGCADTAGGPGAFTNVQSCFSIAVAGDTCYIKNGTYITTNDGTGDASETGGFRLEHSGTAGAPITFRAYPGHSPLLANCAESETTYAPNCDHPTIGANGTVSFVVLDGLRIRGGIWLYGDPSSEATFADGIEIAHCEITQGWGEVGDGNYSAIFLSMHKHAHVHHDYIHDLAVLPGGGEQSSASCIKLYTAIDSVIENNTCMDVRVDESQAGGIDDKQDSLRNTHRFNWIQNVNTCVRIQNQTALYPASTGTEIYGNVCIGAPTTVRACFRSEAGAITDATFRSNTCIGFASGWYADANDSGMDAVRLYDNVFSITSRNVEAYQRPALEDYNAYSSAPAGPRFLIGGTWHDGLADVMAATAFDDHSQELADPGFVGAPGDVHLSPSSSCRGAGRSDGAPAGAVMDVGAYLDATTCIGYTCP